MKAYLNRKTSRNKVLKSILKKIKILNSIGKCWRGLIILSIPLLFITVILYTININEVNNTYLLKLLSFIGFYIFSIFGLNKVYTEKRKFRKILYKRFNLKVDNNNNIFMEGINANFYPKKKIKTIRKCKKV